MAVYKGFAFASEDYAPERVRAGEHTMEEYRAEYKKLYRVAQKRLRSFEKAGRTYTEAYKYNINRIKPLTKLSERELSTALYDVKQFLTAKTGSVSGQKAYEKEAIQSFHEKGLTFINSKNFREFTQFMEDARQQKLGDGIYVSEQTLLLFALAAENDIDPEEIKEDFDFWYEHQKELEEELKKKPDTSLDKIKKLLGK